MGRPATPVGAYGAISVRERRPGVFSAETYYRESETRRVRVARDGKSAAAARRALVRALADWQAQSSAPTSPTVAELVEEVFRERARRWSDATCIAYRSTISGLINGMPLGDAPAAEPGDGPVPGSLGAKPITELTTADVSRLLAKVHSTTPGRVKTLRTLLSLAAGHAVTLGLIERNPVTGAAKFSDPYAHGSGHQPRVVDEAELAALRDAAARYDRGEFRTSGRHALVPVAPLIELGYAIAGRIGEVLSLRWDDVEGLDEPLSDGRVYITVRKSVSRVSREKSELMGRQLRGSYQVKDGTKNGVDRRVPLGERHIELLRRLPRTSEYILPNDKGGFQTQANVGRRLRRMMELAGIQNPERTNFTFHALRRTVATRIAESAGIEAAAFAIGDDPMVAKRHYVEKTTVQVPDYSHLLR
ncbi:tyrosine-type recombinase/integrase [Protaetiibacter sp. SSC-01]|uniref:site-specific integrase n=1 Tax=Protaetiibacter sp. SSC-01 TaxID=2759943 RepID=UPI001656E686|nr:tyrosine-type recombinase/integrase [Protaetiibacter sp. SSC-01]QNO38642.1 tyrosine-type recombinase/integrase [Protaetiibacter sp. SSC-01]